MKKSPAFKSLQVGVLFGILIITMFLIGFTVVGTELVSKVLGNDPGSSLPNVIFFAIFLVLFGLICGNLSIDIKSPGKKNWGHTILSGLSSGLGAAIPTAIIGYIFGNLAEHKIDVRAYLVSISPESITFFLFNQTAIFGSFLLFIIILFSCLAGAILTFITRNNQVIQAYINQTNNSISGLIQSPKLGAFIQNRYARFGFSFLVALAMIILPRTWGSYWNYVFGTVGIYIILGLGLNIITGWAGQLVIGYVAFFAIGAYTFGLLTAPQPHHLQWNFWIALAIGVITAGVSGLLIGLPILNLRGDYLAIVTLGFAEIIRILLKSDLLTPYTGGPRGIQEISGPSFFGKAYGSDIDYMYLILVAVIVVSFLAHRLQHSRQGRALMAINLDETVARATGINAFISKLLALAVSAAIAGLAGAIFASRNQYTGPDDHALMVAINVLCLVIVGGIGNIPGIFLGAFVLKGLPEILREIENYRMLVFGALLVIMMRIRPEGFLPPVRPSLEVIKKMNNPGPISQSHPVNTGNNHSDKEA